MKIFGYKKADTDIEGLMELRDIAFSTSPETLRAIAKFLEDAADELQEMGSDFGHLHLMDEWSDWVDGVPDIQVLNENI